MTKTLADMTPEQRDTCRGRWVKAQGEIGVLLTWEVGLGAVFVPRVNNWLTLPLAEITILPDLLRAWTPDGMPLDTDVEQETVRPHPRGGVIGRYDNPTYTDLTDGTVVRRFVTDWEPIKEDA